jgi:hypothetical protein
LAGAGAGGKIPVRSAPWQYPKYFQTSRGYRDLAMIDAVATDATAPAGA